MPEVTLLKLKKLASKMNKEDKIVGVWKMNKTQLQNALRNKKYRVHYNEKTKKHELRPTVQMNRRVVIKV
jgi:hypothetical protein